VGFTGQSIEVLIVASGALLWTKWSNLDLGLRAPAMRAVWAWSLLFLAWIAIEQVIIAVRPPGMGSEWQGELERLPLAKYLLLLLLLAPVEEELLFRGALFSALMRRWGSTVAIVVPSVLWGLMHIHYGPWLAVSIAGSGVVLAIIRLKSGSLYVPMVLHAGANLLDIIGPNILLVATTQR
jgi:membrane protease YdiL (CAAX protease family)